MYWKNAEELNVPCKEKTCLGGFRPGKRQTRLYCHRICIESLNFGFRN